MIGLTHLDGRGQAHVTGVAAGTETARAVVAEGHASPSPATLAQVAW